MTAVVRLPNWQDRLYGYLRQAAHRPFAEGAHDCALFLAGGIKAMTGHDYAADYRGRYTTTRGGLRILRRDGFQDHVALAAHHLSEKPVAFANVGDGAVVMADGAPALGIVQGGAVFVLGARGLSHVALTQARKVLEV